MPDYMTRYVFSPCLEGHYVHVMNVKQMGIMELFNVTVTFFKMSNWSDCDL